VLQTVAVQLGLAKKLATLAALGLIAAMTTALDATTLRSALLHFMELAAGFERRAGTSGFSEYPFDAVDPGLGTEHVLAGVVESLMAHRAKREQQAKELRVAAVLPALTKWLNETTGDKDLEGPIAAELEGAGITLGPEALADLRAFRDGHDPAINANPSPRGAKEFARDVLGRALGKSRSHMGNLEEVLAGRERPKAAVKTKAVADLLYMETGCSAPELLLSVLVALPSDRGRVLTWVTEALDRFDGDNAPHAIVAGASGGPSVAAAATDPGSTSKPTP
jgi:hypothetical protein